MLWRVAEPLATLVSILESPYPIVGYDGAAFTSNVAGNARMSARMQVADEHFIVHAEPWLGFGDGRRSRTEPGTVNTTRLRGIQDAS